VRHRQSKLQSLYRYMQSILLIGIIVANKNLVYMSWVLARMYNMIYLLCINKKYWTNRLIITTHSYMRIWHVFFHIRPQCYSKWCVFSTSCIYVPKILCSCPSYTSWPPTLIHVRKHSYVHIKLLVSKSYKKLSCITWYGVFMKTNQFFLSFSNYELHRKNNEK
jgi:hypothetical protein